MIRASFSVGNLQASVGGSLLYLLIYFVCLYDLLLIYSFVILKSTLHALYVAMSGKVVSFHENLCSKVCTKYLKGLVYRHAVLL